MTPGPLRVVPLEQLPGVEDDRDLKVDLGTKETADVVHRNFAAEICPSIDRLSSIRKCA